MFGFTETPTSLVTPKDYKPEILEEDEEQEDVNVESSESVAIVRDILCKVLILSIYEPFSKLMRMPTSVFRGR